MAGSGGNYEIFQTEHRFRFPNASIFYEVVGHLIPLSTQELLLVGSNPEKFEQLHGRGAPDESIDRATVVQRLRPAVGVEVAVGTEERAAGGGGAEDGDRRGAAAFAENRAAVLGGHYVGVVDMAIAGEAEAGGVGPAEQERLCVPTKIATFFINSTSFSLVYRPYLCCFLLLSHCLNCFNFLPLEQDWLCRAEEATRGVNGTTC